MSKFIIAITGPSGAGKTTLSKLLLKLFGAHAVCLSTDSYYKGRSENETMEDYLKRNFDHPDELLLDKFAEDVKSLSEGKNIKRPEMDFVGGTFKRKDNAVDVHSSDIIILDGIFPLHHIAVKQLVKEQGVSIFVHAPSAIALKRALQRDVKERYKTPHFVVENYTTNVLGGYYSFIKPHKPDCDLRIATWTPSGNDLSDEQLAENALAGILARIPNELFKLLALSEAITPKLKGELEKHQKQPSFNNSI